MLEGRESGNLRGDLLLCDVNVRRSVIRCIASADAIHLVVDRGPVVISILASTAHGPLHMARMPRTDTSHLPQSLVRLPRQLLGAPSPRHTREPVSLGHGNTVNHLILLKDATDLNRFLKQPLPEINLLSHAAAVDLDLHQVRLLLLQRRLADLGMCEHADDGAVFLDALQFAGYRGAAGLGVLFGIFGEGLLLGFVPVFVEAAFHFVGEVLCPDGGEGT